MLAEITGQCYTGGYNTLNRYLRPLRRLDAATLQSCRRGRRSELSLAGLPAYQPTSTRTMLIDYGRSASAARSWTRPSGTWPDSPR
jgi:hypothetical protein